MPISGLWKEAVSWEASALKQGTGFNPVHRIATEGPAIRQSDAHTAQGGPGVPLSESSPPLELTEYQDPFAYPDEVDFDNPEWGYGPETGTSTRPNAGNLAPDHRGYTPQGFPTPQEYPIGPGTGVGPPEGNEYRDIRVGDNRSSAKLGFKNETVSEGWINKETGGVEDSQESSDVQYTMQTSFQQRDKFRAGSQAAAGRANEQDAPIHSYRPTWAQRIKPWSGGQRHFDMFPFQADQMTRPFLYRNAGTGEVEWMGANEAYNYQVGALQRQPVPDPYSGNPIPGPGNTYDEEASNVQSWIDVEY